MLAVLMLTFISVCFPVIVCERDGVFQSEENPSPSSVDHKNRSGSEGGAKPLNTSEFHPPF